MTEFVALNGWFVAAWLPLSYLVCGLIAYDARCEPRPPPRWRTWGVVALAPLAALLVVAVVVAGGLLEVCGRLGGRE